MKHKLIGLHKTKEIYLDGELLYIAPSQAIRHYADEFDWGICTPGTAQLALAIILQLTGDYKGYSKFKFEVLVGLPKNDSFDFEFDLDYSGIRQKMIHDALACNKNLSKAFLQGKTNRELLCWVHPSYRDQYAFQLGFKRQMENSNSVNYF
jgi:hypothetical protein